MGIFQFAPILLLNQDPLDDIQTIEAIQEEKEKILICAQCQTPITKDKERIPVNGSHEHSVFNPQGIVYHIGCFNQATGCKPVSKPSTEFSWFKGYQWRIICCEGCFTHMGWDFSQTEGIAFYGLILDRLRTGTD